MTTAYPGVKTGGGTLQEAQESALGTPGAYTYRRVDGDLTLPTATRQLIKQPNLGHRVAANRSDQPVAFEKGLESAFVFPQYLRRNATNGTMPPLVRHLLSAGCSESHLSTKSEIDTAGYLGLTSWVLKADVVDNAAGANTGGHAHLVQLSSGVYWPTLISGYAFGTRTVKSSMGLPSVSAAGKVIQQCYTVYPPYGNQVNTAKTMAFKALNKADGGSNNMETVLTGCALASVPTISLVPNELPIINSTWHVADVDFADTAATSETFTEMTYILPVGGEFEFGYASANVAGEIANTTAEMIKAEIDLGIRVVPILAEGTSTCLNGWAGYMAYCDEPTIKVDMIMDVARYTDLEATSQTEKYLHFIQGSTNLDACMWGFWFPRCYLSDVVSTNINEEFLKVSCTYTAYSAGYGSQYGDTDPEMAPWYVGISNEET